MGREAAEAEAHQRPKVFERPQRHYRNSSNMLGRPLLLCHRTGISVSFALLFMILPLWRCKLVSPESDVRESDHAQAGSRGCNFGATDGNVRGCKSGRPRASSCTGLSAANRRAAVQLDRVLSGRQSRGWVEQREPDRQLIWCELERQ